MTSRKWCFTLHLDKQPSELAEVCAEWDMSKVTYLVYQLEVAPTTGALHAQGAIALSTSLRLTAMKKMMRSQAIHLEPARNWEKAKQYCMKAETRVAGTEPFEWGAETSQGQRSDLATAASLVEAGQNMREIAKVCPVTYIRCYKGLNALQQMMHPPKAIVRKVGLFWGSTETGKTRMVFDNLEDVYTVADLKAPWFDNYKGEANVLMDECGANMMHHNLLKRLLDRYPMSVPIKGGFTQWNASTIIMTSNMPIDDWYYGLPQADLQALKRRVRIFEFPRDKALAEAWLTGRLIENGKRDREPEDDHDSGDGWNVPQDLYDLCGN